jgi:hypothetical protein
MTPNAYPQATSAADHAALAPLDIADAMDLLALVANDPSRDLTVRPASSSNTTDGPNRYAYDGEPHGIIGYALATAKVAVNELESMCGHTLRELYRDGRMPIPITLGALIVLDAAQRSQDHGRQRHEVLDDATAAAARFLDLVSVVAVLPRGCDPRHAFRDLTSRGRRARPLPRESSCEFSHAI